MTLTIVELFDALPGRLITEEAADVQATLQWQITDMEPGVWAFRIEDSAGQLIPGGVPDPDTTFTTTSDIWLGIAEGREDPMKAFMTGKMKVEGDMVLALKVPDLFETGELPSPPAAHAPGS